MQDQLPPGTTAISIVSLVLWRDACGKIGGKTSLSADECAEVTRQIGAPILSSVVRSTYGAMIQRSIVDVHRNPQGRDNPTVFKVNTKTRQQAEECAAALGTAVVPPKMKSPSVTVADAAPIAEPPTKQESPSMPTLTDTRALIDGLHDVICLAESADDLRAENGRLREAAESRTSADTRAVDDAVAVLMTLDGLCATAVGMLLQEKHPGLVTGAKAIADRLKGAV